MTFDNATRARIARGWAATSLDQPTYAAQHGISTRTLRDWVRRFGGDRRPHPQLRAAVVATIDQLQNVLAALDAEAAADSAAAPEDWHEVAERHATSEVPVTRGRGTPVSPLAKRLASPTTMRLDGERAVGARRTAAVRDIETAVNVPEVAGPVLAAPAAVAVVDGAGEAPAPSRPAGDTAAGVLDFEALRQRLRQRPAERAASGAPRRNPFLDWDVE